MDREKEKALTIKIGHKFVNDLVYVLLDKIDHKLGELHADLVSNKLLTNKMIIAIITDSLTNTTRHLQLDVISRIKRTNYGSKETMEAILKHFKKTMIEQFEKEGI